MEKIQGFLNKTGIQSRLEQIIWVQIPDPYLTDVQSSHRDCQPHAFAVELGSDWIKIELFVRSLKRMRCTCPGFCSDRQRDFIHGFADNMLKQLQIQT
jgi:hypothetical protein